MVSKSHKKSAVYKSEVEIFLKSICENACFFPYSEKFFSKMTCRKCFLRIISEGVLLKLRKISRKLPPNRPKFSQWVKGQILRIQKNFTQGVKKSPIFMVIYERTFKNEKILLVKFKKIAPYYKSEEEFFMQGV